MDPDVMGAAAAVEALKLTASGKHADAPYGGGTRRDDDVGPGSNAPAGGMRPDGSCPGPAGGQKPTYDDEDDDTAASAPRGGGSMQDKVVSLMSPYGG